MLNAVTPIGAAFLSAAAFDPPALVPVDSIERLSRGSPKSFHTTQIQQFAANLLVRTLAV